ncbi:hypothetical protein N0V82_009555 [Gnomoniopsis sp. IMI 355080]|nr:hypothetical protein N0V82_009555 [Gnomoniopsis sp. IMI 355080]
MAEQAPEVARDTMDESALGRQPSLCNDNGSALNIQDWEAFNALSNEDHQYPIDALYAAGDTTSRGNLPERIRINAQPVLRILRNVCGARFHEGKPVVIFRPYKVLLHHERLIRERVTEAQDSMENSLHAEPAVIQTSQPSSGNHSSDKQTEVDQLRSLMSFMDDLSARVAFVQSCECSSIRFSDLYLLYQPGDVVISRDYRQAYRIIKVESERRIEYKNQKVVVEDGAFIIHCIYIDFDGERLGPVLRKIFMQPWILTKALLSLEILPLRLAEMHQKDLLSNLSSRGATFVKVAGISEHMHYVGRTLDSNKDVNGTVIIDFQEAFRHSEKHDEYNDSETKMGWRPSLEVDLKDAHLFALGFDECEESEETFPSMGDLIYDDSYVDAIRHRDFIWEQVTSSESEPRNSNTIKVLDAQYMSGIKSLTEAELTIMNHRVFGFIPDLFEWGESSQHFEL